MEDQITQKIDGHTGLGLGPEEAGWDLNRSQATGLDMEEKMPVVSAFSMKQETAVHWTHSGLV